MPDQIMSLKEVADLVGLSESYFSTMLREGEGPRWFKVRENGHYRFRRADVDRWIKSRFGPRSS